MPPPADLRSPRLEHRVDERRLAARPRRVDRLAEVGAIEGLQRHPQLGIGARLLLRRSVAMAVEAQADVEVVGDARSTSRSTWRAVAMRVVLPSGRFIDPDRSRMISRFFRVFGAAATRDRRDRERAGPPLARSDAQGGVGVAGRAAHRHPPRLRQRRRQRQRQRRLAFVAERDGVRIDARVEIAERRRRVERQAHRPV